jgi:hypothetical protein
MPKPRPPPGSDSPNLKIDKAINALLAKLEASDDKSIVAIDDAVRVVNAAIAWEKVKHQIKDKGDGFDADEL